MTITVEQVIALSPCPDYPEARLRRLFPATLHGALTRWDGPWAKVFSADRLWLAVRVLPRPLIRRWLAVIVERKMSRTPNPDPRSLAVLPYLRRGLAVPDAVRRAADAAVDDSIDFDDSTAADADIYTGAFVAAAASVYAAADIYAGATAAANSAASLTSAVARRTERRQQLADLLKLVKKEMP
jgi:hypothetical protein